MEKRFAPASWLDLVGLGVRYNLGSGQKSVLLDARCVAGGLGATFAIFAATTAPAVDDGAQVNMFAAKTLLNHFCAFRQLIKRSGEEKRQIVAACYPIAVDDFFAKREDSVSFIT